MGIYTGKLILRAIWVIALTCRATVLGVQGVVGLYTTASPLFASPAEASSSQSNVAVTPRRVAYETTYAETDLPLVYKNSTSKT